MELEGQTDMLGLDSAEPFIAEEPVTEVIETDSAQAGSLMAAALEAASFAQSVNIDDVIISVRAADGAFPEGASLSVSKIPLRAQIFVDEAIGKERGEDVYVAASYSFDISIKDADGNELQPAEGHEVEVSFELAEVADQNLETSVFHIGEEDGEMSASSLDVTVSDNTAVVMAESFSVYTVEFTYGGRQYVMQGGTVLPLRTILEDIGLYGEATNVEVSDSELFEAYLQYGEWYVESKLPFLTDEWMRVTIAGIEYEIKVTDMLPAYGAAGTVPVSKITQGTDGVTFAENAPLSSIQIDYSILGDLSRAEYQKITSDPGLITIPGTQLYYTETAKGATADQSGIFAVYDTNQNGAYTSTLSKTADNVIPGDLFSFTYRDAAILEDESLGDVVITYSNLHIDLQSNTSVYKGTYYIASGNMIRAGNTNPATYKQNGKEYYYNNRSGIQVDINIHVVDKEGNLVNGTFMFPMTDIDVTRETAASFATIYNAGINNSYSEQVAIRSGYIGGIYIPDYEGIDEEKALKAIGMSLDKVTAANRGYKTGIEDYQEGVRFVGIGKGDADPGTYYSGFVTVADNTSGGINVTVWTAGSKGSPVRTSLLSGKQSIDHKIRSTTTGGGSINTTIMGNPNGDISDGSTVLGPSTVVVPDGKTVKYTMTPDPGYMCDGISIGDKLDSSQHKVVIPPSELEKLINGELAEINVILNEGGYLETVYNLTNQVDERQGKLTYNPGNGSFVFEFPNNNYDHRIDVAWKWIPIHDLEVKKIVMGNQSSAYQYFPFTIRIEIPSGADTSRCELDPGNTSYDSDEAVMAGIYYKPTDAVNQPSTIADFIPAPGEAKEVTVWLRNGQGLKILNLPDGTTYSVTEDPGDYTETVIRDSISWKSTDTPGSSSDYRGSVKTEGRFSSQLVQVCEPAAPGTTGRYIKAGTKTCYQQVDGSYSGTRYDYDEIKGVYLENTSGSGSYGKLEIDLYEEIDPSSYSGGEQTYNEVSSYLLYEKAHVITHINEKDAPVPTMVSLGFLPALSFVVAGLGGIGGVFLCRRRDDDE
jgi:hypothetical protein